MQWRRRHCCPIKMTWNVKRSLFRTHVAGLLSLASLFALFLIYYHQDLLQGRSWLRDNPLVYTMRGLRPHKGLAKGNQSSLRSLWKDNGYVLAKPSVNFNFSSHLAEITARGIEGLEISPSGNDSNTNGNTKSLHREMGVGGRLATQPYHWLLNEPYKCNESSPFLVLLIAAEPRQLEARNAIRQTWGNESVALGYGFVRLFLLGRIPNAYPQSSIEEESLQYHDIIQQDFLDTYYNLTIKTLMGMSWVARYCPHARYVMKTDSDMFVNTEYLIQKLLKPSVAPRQNYFTGYLMRGYAPNRNKDSKWYMPPELYSSERYPIFCSGTGYVFSGDMAVKIYNASLSIRRLHLEDVYVGICLAKLRIDPVPPPNEFLFNHWRVSYSSCKYSHLITSHQFQPNELIKYWSHLQSNKHNPCLNMVKDKSGRPRHRKLQWEGLR